MVPFLSDQQKSSICEYLSVSVKNRLQVTMPRGLRVGVKHHVYPKVHLHALPGAHYHHGHRHVHPHVNSVHYHPHYSHISTFFIIVAVVLVLGAVVGVSVWAYLNAKNTVSSTYEERMAANMVLAHKESEEEVE